MSKLSADLNLQEMPQDWGMINSDSDRIEEFIDYYEWNKIEHKVKAGEELEALAELIFNSVEDGFAMGVVDDEIRERVQEFIAENAKDFQKTLKYWSSLGSEEWNSLTALKA